MELLGAPAIIANLVSGERVQSPITYIHVHCSLPYTPLLGSKCRQLTTLVHAIGTGAFFKSHTDTPTRGNMFGSLVHSCLSNSALRRHAPLPPPWPRAREDLRLRRTPCGHVQPPRTHRILQRRRARSHTCHLRPSHHRHISTALFWSDSEEAEVEGNITGTQPDPSRYVLQPPSANATDVVRVLAKA